MNFNKFYTFIFDLDGTIWSWNNLHPGAKEIIEKLQKLRKQIIFITNNTLLSRTKLLEKIKNFGIEVEKHQLITSGFVAAQYLFRRGAKVLAFGDGVKEDLREGGIELTESSDCQFLVIGYDKEFNLNSLSLAKEALEKGARFLATSKDKLWLCDNEILPGTGTIVSLVERFCRKKAKILGKPSDIFGKVLWSFVTASTDKVVLIGDNSRTDIPLGKVFGFHTILVLTGIDKKPGKIKPDLVINSIAEIQI
ncbi:MAG: HAD-IIA family hydrolase [Candidatus Aenigmarchaeota archaeon]|nr:HAD-IIA family hydrolase [Candidatus Aenigmarchaeota archaeon]